MNFFKYPGASFFVKKLLAYSFLPLYAIVKKIFIIYCKSIVVLLVFLYPRQCNKFRTSKSTKTLTEPGLNFHTYNTLRYFRHKMRFLVCFRKIVTMKERLLFFFVFCKKYSVRNTHIWPSAFCLLHAFCKLWKELENNLLIWRLKSREIPKVLILFFL